MADALVLPGRLFGPGSPSLMFSGDVAERRGAAVHRHSWAAVPPTGPERAEWVCDAVALAD